MLIFVWSWWRFTWWNPLYTNTCHLYRERIELFSWHLVLRVKDFFKMDHPIMCSPTWHPRWPVYHPVITRPRCLFKNRVHITWWFWLTPDHRKGITFLVTMLNQCSIEMKLLTHCLFLNKWPTLLSDLCLCLPGRTCIQNRNYVILHRAIIGFPWELQVEVLASKEMQGCRGAVRWTIEMLLLCFLTPTQAYWAISPIIL